MTKKDRNKRRSGKHKKGTSSLAKRQGETSTSHPGAMRRQKGREGGWEVGRTHTRIHSPFEEGCFHEWDGKLALAQDRAPSRGEPGEPRGSYTDQRTPSPQLGGTDNYATIKETYREICFARGIKNKPTNEKKRK